MPHKAVRVAILAIYVRGADAIGLQLSASVRVFIRLGHTVRVFAEAAQPDTPPDVLALTTVTNGWQLAHSPDWAYVESCDLVICDYPAYYRLAECVRLLDGPAVWFNYHGVTPPALWPDAAGRTLLEQGRRRAALVHWADWATAHSDWTRHELHHITGFPLERINVMPYVVEPLDAPPDHGIPNAAPLLLAVGRIAAHKQPAVLVEVLARVCEKLPQARLVFVGDVRGAAHAPVWTEVQQRAAALGVRDAVFCTGAVEHTLLPMLYAQAAVLVSASLHEGFCIPVAEAMAHGVPVVTVDVGALPETVSNAGLVVPVGNVEAFAVAVERVLTDLELRRSLIERGLQRAQLWTPAAVAAHTQQVLDQLPARAQQWRALPRLGQLIDVGALDAAAEVVQPLPSPKRIPFISAVAARLRRWLNSDVERRIDALEGRQVTYNREIARVLHAADELTALLSERIMAGGGVVPLLDASLREQRRLRRAVAVLRKQVEQDDGA